MTKRTMRGLVGSVGAVAAAVALMFTGATVANAAPTIPPADATGSLNITKYTQPDDQQTEANGLPKEAPAGSEPLEGVTFSVTKVEGLDLSTNAGWQAAAAMTVAQAEDAATGTPYTGTTDANGRVRFGVNTDADSTLAAAWNSVTNSIAANGTLPVGLYLVQETGYVPVAGAPQNVTFGAPFLVAVPLTNPTALDSWMYNIYLYPKNSTGNTKTVHEGGIVPGSNVQWTILGDIQQSTSIAQYTVTDKLDARLSTAADGSGVSVSITNAPGTGELNLVQCTGDNEPANCDYTIEVTPLSGADAGKTQVTVDFTTTGRGKLVLAWLGNSGTVSASNSRQVQVVINATVNQLIDEGTPTNGEITNSATITPNSDITTNTNDVTTKWGSLQFTKVAAPTKAPLPGTEFRIVGKDPAVTEAGSAGNPWLSADTWSGTAVTNSSTFVSGTDGKVIISGLRYSNWANGQMQNPFVDNGNNTCVDYTGGGTDCVPNPDYQAYWLVETKARSGYELLAQPIKFTITQPTSVLSGGAQLENIPSNGGFELPLTGGTGTVLLTVLGVGLLAAVLVVARRRQSAQSAE